MLVVGISAFYHDTAAALVRDGEIVAAAQEERFTRKKHDSRFPRHALEYCLAEAGVGLDQVDLVAFYDKPFLKFERLLETYLAFAPRGFESFRMAIPIWLREKLFLKDLLHNQLRQHCPDFDWDERLVFSEHHLSHAASAFFPSPYASAAVLTLDGVGEWATSSLALGRDNRLEVIKEIHFPHSLGPAVFRLHLLHRLQGQLRRVQADGARALRRAALHGADPRQADRSQGGRLVQARTSTTSTTASG